MGQQQLLLIVLGVIIVGIAIAVGISMFKSNAQTSNRDQLINDLNNLAAKAEQYFRKPVAMAGGGQSFAGFHIAPVDSSNGNGEYTVSNNVATAPSAFSGITNYGGNAGGDNATPPSVTDTVLYIAGWGTEVGNDGSHKVQVYVTVTSNNIVAHVVN